MPRARKFACALCKHAFMLHAPYCEKKGCLCRGYITKKEKILLHDHKITLDALLHAKVQEVYKAGRELEQELKKTVPKTRRKILQSNPDAISPEQQYITLTKLKTDWKAFLWYCSICKKKDTYAKMLHHYHYDKILKIKKRH